MCGIEEILFGGILAIAGIVDMKTKCLPVWLLSFMSALAVVLLCIKGGNFWDVAMGLTLGVLFFVVSKYTGEKIGYGDSWIILSLGIFVGGKQLLVILFFASFFVGIFSLVLGLRRGWNKKTTIPFIPFLAIVYWVVMVV